MDRAIHLSQTGLSPSPASLLAGSFFVPSVWITNHQSDEPAPKAERDCRPREQAEEARALYQGLRSDLLVNATENCEWTLAKQQSKNPEDVLESTARLFIKKATDANGVPQYQIDALQVIMSALSMETAAKLLGAMNNSGEEEAVEIDFKSPEEAPKEGQRTAA